MSTTPASSAPGPTGGLAAAAFRNALDGVTTNVMLADLDLRIVYMNRALVATLRAAEREIQRDLPGFAVDDLLGRSIDEFHRNPRHQRSMLKRLTEVHRASIALGGRSFNLVVTPSRDDGGQITGFAVEWADVTAQVATDAERARMGVELARIKAALDGSSTNVMIANERFEIVYMNDTLVAMLRRNEAAIQRDLPQFRVEGLIGTSIDRFHRNPAHQRHVLGNLRGSHKVAMNLGGRHFELCASSARAADGSLAGFSVEWVDVTDQVMAQREVERALSAAAGGDLTQRIATDGLTGFVRQVGEGMNRLIDSLAEALRQVKSAVEQIGEASTQLSQTSQLMSASSVQLNRAADESSTAMARSADMVKSTADNAAMANQLVTLTSTAASGGQKRMEEMTQAMGEINASAQQIAKIIKVIDEIAFQTNLLALNAAVEAARAGRHGKGFAVVAQEVRNLAERSAKAAKETAQLIEEAVGRVGQGVRIADATRGALGEIVGNVVKVVDLVGEIATGSGDQSRTIRAVTESIRQVAESAQAGSQQSNEVVVVPSASGGNGHGGHGSSGSNGSNGHGKDPRAVLPLDQDERGFGGF